MEAWFKASHAEKAVAEHLFCIDRAAAAFHFQQAAEKVLKSLLILIGVEPPKTHDLTALWALLSRHGLLVEPDDALRTRLNKLSLMNVVSRYPVMDETVAPSDWITEGDLAEARAACEHVFLAVNSVTLGSRFDGLEDAANGVKP